MGESIGIVTQGPFDDKPTERLVDCVCTKDGLAVHQYPSDLLNNWTVTHIASGLAVGRGGAFQEDAIAAMHDLLTIADWSQDQEHLPTKEIDKEARRIIERHGMVRLT